MLNQDGSGGWTGNVSIRGSSVCGCFYVRALLRLYAPQELWQERRLQTSLLLSDGLHVTLTLSCVANPLVECLVSSDWFVILQLALDCC